MVIFDVKVLTVILRDYPQPMLDVKDMHAWGKLIGAAQEGVKRCKTADFYFIVVFENAVKGFLVCA